MPFTFEIWPVTPEQGFDLCCRGVLPEPVRHPRLLDAIIHAAQLGHALPGEICIYDTRRQLVERLPLKEHPLPLCVGRP